MHLRLTTVASVGMPLKRARRFTVSHSICVSTPAAVNARVLDSAGARFSVSATVDCRNQNSTEADTEEAALQALLRRWPTARGRRPHPPHAHRAEIREGTVYDDGVIGGSVGGHMMYWGSITQLQ
eukprot:COSAG04_NODE_9174_length_891_cov_0.967172_1_plen_125_part_00